MTVTVIDADQEINFDLSDLDPALVAKLRAEGVPDDAIEQGFEDRFWPEWFCPVSEKYTGPRLELPEILGRGATGDSELWAIMVAIDCGYSLAEFRRAVVAHPDRLCSRYIAAMLRIKRWKIEVWEGTRVPVGLLQRVWPFRQPLLRLAPPRPGEASE